METREKTELEQLHIRHMVIKVLIGHGVETRGSTVTDLKVTFLCRLRGYREYRPQH